MRRAVALLLLVNALGSQALQSGWLGERVAPAVVVQGPRQALVIAESATAPPQLAMAIVQLRAGVGAEYLAAKGHTLELVDPDDQDATGQPSSAVARARPHLLDCPPPCVLVFDGDRLTGKAPLSAAPTSREILDVIRAGGG